MAENNRWLLGLGAGLGALTLGGLYILRKSGESSVDSSLESSRRNLNTSKPQLDQSTSSSLTEQTADSLRQKGNQFFKLKNFKKATDYYNQALAVLTEQEYAAGDQASDSEESQPLAQLRATIYNNLSACSERLGKFDETAVLCIKCLELQNDYKKAWARLEKTIISEKVEIDPYEYFVILTALNIYKEFKDKPIMDKADQVLTNMCSQTASTEFQNRVVGSFPTVRYLRLYWRTFTSFDECAFYEMLPLNEQEDLQCTLTELEKRPIKQAVKTESDSETSDAPETPQPLSVDELLVRATLYLVAANYKAALFDLERGSKHAEASKLHRVYCQIQIAAIFSQLGQPEMAILHFGQAVNHRASNADVYYHRAQLYLGIGRLDAALVDMQEALKCDSQHALASSYISLLEYQMAYQSDDSAEQERIMDDFASKISQFPDCAELYALYAQCECMRRNYEQAITLYDKCYEIDGSSANALCHKALILLKTGKAEESIQLLSTILMEVDEENEFVYETLGSIAAQQGDLISAIESFAKAISSSRNRSEIYQFFARYFTTKARLECQQRFGLDLVPR